MKQAGERSAANPHAAFDAAGTGNVTTVDGMRSIAKAVEVPPEPNVYAPVLDPTDERDVETGHGLANEAPATERAGNG